MFGLLAAANVGGWAWALVAFRDHPPLLGTGWLAYSFGLRLAVDADHIAAIDDVARKLMQQGQRPAAVGLFFSLGLQGVFRDSVGMLNSNFGVLGYAIVGLFAVGWIASVLVDRLKGYDRLNVEA